MDNCSAQTPTDLFPRSTLIVDTASYALTDASGLTVLTTNQDGRVGITTFHHSKDGFQKKKYVVLGDEVWRSGDLNLHELIAKKEVPIRATRLTNQPSGTRFHAVVTALLSKTPKNANMSKVYVFAENHGQVRTILVKEFYGSPDIILDDVNDDGQPELLVEWTDESGKEGDISMWSVSPTDALSEVTFPDDGKYLTNVRTYFRRVEEVYYGPGNYTLIAVASMLRDSEAFRREIRFRWSEETHTYQITGVVDIRQTSVDVPLK